MENLSADLTAEVSQVTPASMADSYQSISDMMPLDSYSTQSASNSQVAENNFLTDFSSVKNKTGNGLKSKNSNKRQEFVQNGSYAADDDFIPKRLKLETNIPDPSLELDFLNRRSDKNVKELGSANINLETNSSALSNNSSACSSSSSSPAPSLAQLNRQLDWQFNQGDGIAKNISPPIVDLSTPEVITVEGTPSPLSSAHNEPVVVDLCQTDQAEIQMLYNSFCQMFPNTPNLYLEQQAADLVGKHAAINRFIDELFANNSNPPDYWKSNNHDPLDRPNNDADVTELIQQTENDLTTLFDDSCQNIDSLIETHNSNSIPKVDPPLTINTPQNNSTPNTPDLYDNPVPGPSGAPKNGPTPALVLTGPEGMVPAEEETSDLEKIKPSKGDGPTGTITEVTVVTDEERREQQMDKRVQNLLSLFPQKDPEYLRAKNNEFGLDKEGATAFEAWVLEVVENGGKDLPSKEDYHRRKKEEEVLEKYSGQVTVEEVLKWYNGDPEAYFSDLTRTVDELYKKHCLAQLKKEFRTTTVATIDKLFRKNSGLYVPSFRALKQHQAPKRKTRRPDHECGHPKEICLNFLKELQYSKIDQEVIKHIENEKDLKRKIVEEARKNNQLQECGCCYNDECLLEDMLPCREGHNFCIECVQRGSEVAMGDGKITLQCLGDCTAIFDLTCLQKALKPEMFSKWFRKIQMAEIGEAGLQGLEECPFCQYTTIMDTTPEENKVFQCLHPDCGVESCRLCHELSHIPLRCDEVEKDAEVRKRTYIENKMTEALVRQCWKCHKPFIKIDGCNKMTCECGAQMCYLCRKPVHNGYNHFYGQGGSPKAGRNCPLFTNNSQIHESDVARGAKQAKAEMDHENPSVALKYDPTADIAMPNDPVEQQDQRGDGVLDGLLPADPRERERFLQQQQQLMDNITRNNHPNARPPVEGGDHRGRPNNVQLINNRNQANPNGLLNGNHLNNVPDPWHQRQGVNNLGQALNQNFNNHFPRPAFDVNGHLQAQYPQVPPHLHHGLAPAANPQAYPGDYNGFVDRMGELLQLREAQRQRQRAIRRQEQQLQEAFQLHRIVANNDINPQQPLGIRDRELGIRQQALHHNRPQVVQNQQNVIVNAAPVNVAKHTHPRATGAAVTTANQTQPINPTNHNNHYNNAAINPNPLLVPPSLHMQDHHYAYHQRIQRHLNPVPNPIQPPPKAGSFRGSGPPPPAHHAIPHTVDLPPVPTSTSSTSVIHPNSMPPPLHPRPSPHQSTSNLARRLNQGPSSNTVHNSNPQKKKNIDSQNNLGPIKANVAYPSGASGSVLDLHPRATFIPSQSSNTKSIPPQVKHLGKPRTNSS